MYILLPLKFHIKSVVEREQFWHSPQDYLPFHVENSEYEDTLLVYCPLDLKEETDSLEEFLQTVCEHLGYPISLNMTALKALYPDGAISTVSL